MLRVNTQSHIFLLGIVVEQHVRLLGFSAITECPECICICAICVPIEGTSIRGSTMVVGSYRLLDVTVTVA